MNTYTVWKPQILAILLSSRKWAPFGANSCQIDHKTIEDVAGGLSRRVLQDIDNTWYTYLYNNKTNNNNNNNNNNIYISQQW
jgi:hypothetical protein